MRQIINLLPVLFIAFAMTSCSTDGLDEEVTYQSEFIIPEAKTIEIEILDLINNYRISKELAPLISLEIIKSQTFSHTDYMTSIEDVNHDFFFSRKSFLVDNANALKVSENVAYGYSTAASVVNAWINSDGHRGNIEGDFTHFEVSAEKGSNNKWYFTNIFIKK